MNLAFRPAGPYRPAMAHGAAHTHDHHDHGPEDGHEHGYEHGHEHGPDRGRHQDRAGGHSHTHEHGHPHHHVGGHGNETRVAAAAVLTGLFMLAEVVGGVVSGSLALLADAGHMLSDAGSLVLAWVGFRIARRPADAQRTFGFRRFSVLAAFTNGLALVAVAVWIILEAGMRLWSPAPVMAVPMLWVAVGGLAVNILAFFVLHGAEKDNLNMRGALMHVVGDLLGSVAAIAAALIIMATGWTPADPLLSVLVALLILRSSVSLIRESGHILLEGAPRRLDLDKVSRDLEQNVEGVIDIHHAHAWSLDEARPMMTLHARIADAAAGPAIVAAIKNRLHETHGVGHVTVEIETDDCRSADCA